MRDQNPSVPSKIVNRLRSFGYLAWNEVEKSYRRLFPGQHQLTSTTSADRYPELFAEAANLLNANSQPCRILSYGCSTGEECFSLKRYMPNSTIIGLDINRNNLKKARAANASKDILFLESNAENLTQHGPYDAIFALSVLCRWEDTKFVNNCEKIYPFEKFASTVSQLTSQLNVGGLFVVYNSNFRFEDTPDFRCFEVVPTPTVMDSGFVKKFDRKNFELNDSHSNCVYRKISS